MRQLNGFDIVALTLVIIGALNWGLVGFFNYDLVRSLFGEGDGITRVIFALVGLAGIYLIYLLTRPARSIDKADI